MDLSFIIAFVALFVPTIGFLINNHYNRKVRTLELRIDNLKRQIAFKRSLIHRLNSARGKLEYYGPKSDGEIQTEVIGVAADSFAIFKDSQIKMDFENLSNTVLQNHISYRELIRKCLNHLSNSIFEDQAEIDRLITHFRHSWF
ncbi:hypothetical protein [Lactobacillus sp. 3B(2020)]|uniref:hypothetical protein n=1 Tax=Lactobacillus sp. 3B(2020) TaxID=2695882 RepID=UPI0015DF2235|nr:hypothetical protein [Lactobacillus sp. 3B(2020)]QLL70253.1 hypothetical protein GTO83_06740 [Lactobacillus sp. 3B(2020)]